MLSRILHLVRVARCVRACVRLPVSRKLVYHWAELEHVTTPEPISARRMQRADWLRLRVSPWVWGEALAKVGLEVGDGKVGHPGAGLSDGRCSE